jgi:hypothetical protein
LEGLPLRSSRIPSCRSATRGGACSLVLQKNSRCGSRSLCSAAAGTVWVCSRWAVNCTCVAWWVVWLTDWPSLVASLLSAQRRLSVVRAPLWICWHRSSLVFQCPVACDVNGVTEQSAKRSSRLAAEMGLALHAPGVGPVVEGAHTAPRRSPRGQTQAARGANDRPQGQLACLVLLSVC